MPCLPAYSKAQLLGTISVPGKRTHCHECSKNLQPTKVSRTRHYLETSLPFLFLITELMRISASECVNRPRLPGMQENEFETQQEQ